MVFPREYLLPSGSAQASCDSGQLKDFFKQPDGVAECALKWAHAPGWIVLALVVVTFVLAWVEFARKRAREAARARQAFRDWTSNKQRSGARVAGYSTVVLAAVYAVARLGEVTFGTSEGPTSMFEGMANSQIYPIDYQWSRVTSRPYVTYVTGWALVCAVATIALLLYAVVTASSGLRSFSTFVLRSVYLLSMLAALVSAVGAAGNLLEDPPLSRTAPFFFGMWAVSLAALFFGVDKLEDAGDGLAYAFRAT